MRLISIVLTLVLIGAVFVPMVMEDPTGKPLMSPEDWIPETPEVVKPSTPIYKWQDEFGNWQFGENPPPNVAAVLHEVDSDAVTPMGSEWRVAPKEDTGSTVNAPNMRSRVQDLLSNAKSAAEQMERSAADRQRQSTPD